MSNKSADTSNGLGFVETLIGDGRPLLAVSALALIAFGAFAVFIGVTGQFLPHDSAYLRMTSQELCSLQACRIVHFMIHDRIAFGGVLVAIGIIYLWLVEFPLKGGEGWAWWTLVASSSVGFLSFLAYLGYGYLDTWHGIATLGLLPLFGAGLWFTRALRRSCSPRPPLDLMTRHGRGRALLVCATFGIAASGTVITLVGATTVFVPPDLAFMGLSVAQLRSLNVRLISLIAHDRAGFGGALLSCGIAMLISITRSRLDRSLCQALALAGGSGFGAAIGVHPAIGYLSFTHLAPAVVGCLVYGAGLVLGWPARVSRGAGG